MSDTLIVPPFRTALLTSDGKPLSTVPGGNGAAGTPDGRIRIETAKEWWLYWRTLAELANAGIQMITFGGHGDRPLADGMPDGAIYVEQDRSGIIYQNQGGEWHYLAGTMYGKMSPDERPTDLGVNDAGFQFRSTDLPARYFIWSGAMWVETTPVRYGTHAARLAAAVGGLVSGMLWMETDRDNVIYQVQTVSGSPAWVYADGTMTGLLSERPSDLTANDVNFAFATSDTLEVYRWSGSAWVNQTPAASTPQPNTVQVAMAGASLTLTTSFADVPSLSITLPVPGNYFAIGVMDYSVASLDVNNNFLAQLILPTGAAAPQLVVFGAAATATRATVCQQWIFTSTSAGQTIKIQARKGGGTGASITSASCSLSAIWISP